MSVANKMTYKQKQFVNKFIVNRGNGTQAAMDTYDVKNKNSAAVLASNLLRNVKVREAINSSLMREEGFTVYMIEELKKSMQSTSSSERFRALRLAFKLYGYSL